MQGVEPDCALAPRPTLQLQAGDADAHQLERGGAGRSDNSSPRNAAGKVRGAQRPTTAAPHDGETLGQTRIERVGAEALPSSRRQG
eukprot:1440744-Rhodomonas_salina.3